MPITLYTRISISLPQEREYIRVWHFSRHIPLVLFMCSMRTPQDECSRDLRGMSLISVQIDRSSLLFLLNTFFECSQSSSAFIFPSFSRTEWPNLWFVKEIS